MVNIKVTQRVKATPKANTQSDVAPATPVSTVSVATFETPGSIASAGRLDDVEDSDVSVTSKKKIPKKHPNYYADDPMVVDLKPKAKRRNQTSTTTMKYPSVMTSSSNFQTTRKTATTTRFIPWETRKNQELQNLQF